MTHVLNNPAGLHDPVAYGYSHVADVPSGGLVLVAGQYGSDASGEVVSDDFTAQVEQAFSNLGAALSSRGLSYRDVARLGTYIVDHDEGRLHRLLAVISSIWGDRPPTQTLLGVASLALPGMLFEVDAVAVRPS